MAAIHPSFDDWVIETVRVTDFVGPTANVRLRFSIEDSGDITEGGIDFLRVLNVDCDGGDDVGTAYCASNPNSTGVPSSIRGEGSNVVADNDFTLITENVPSGAFGFYFFGPDQTQTPAADGFICVSGSLLRLLPASQSSLGGVATRAVDLTDPLISGTVVPGASLNFQLWHRDVGGAGSNFSNALNVVWQ